MKKIWLVRHAQSRAQTEEEYGIDTGLSGKGKLQARRLKKALKNIEFDRIFLSPLKRARETFELSGLKKKNVEFDSRLIEELPDDAYNYILPYEKLPSYGKKDVHNAWLKDAKIRAKLFLSDVYFMEGKCFLVLSHAGFINNLLSVFLLQDNLLFEPVLTFCMMNNAAISVIVLGKPEKHDVLLSWNDIRHIDNLVEFDPITSTPAEQTVPEQMVKFAGRNSER